MPGLGRAAIVGSLIVLVACVARPPGPEKINLAPVGFDSLVGWQQDNQSVALAAFRRSCARIERQPQGNPVGVTHLGGVGADWRVPCMAAVALGDNDAKARAFFEGFFAPFRVSGRGAKEGLFTGYYEPLLSGARERGGRYTVPIYGRPTDLVTVDLGDFRPDAFARSKLETGRHAQP